MDKKKSISQIMQEYNYQLLAYSAELAILLHDKNNTNSEHLERLIIFNPDKSESDEFNNICINTNYRTNVILTDKEALVIANKMVDIVKLVGATFFSFDYDFCEDSILNSTLAYYNESEECVLNV